MIQLLVINDNSFTAGKQTINNIEFNILTADSPLQAFNQIIKTSPDAIAFNIANPGMDAEKVIKRIRNMQASKCTPILMFVECERETFAKNLIDSEYTSYFTMPVTQYETLDWAIKALGVVQPAQQKVVLVVDDDPVILNMTKMFLGAKYRVITAGSANETFEQLKVLTPDLILLDIAMPDMDGKELFTKIRFVAGCEKIPILFQTGMAGVNTVKECVKLGAAGFVVKPVQKQVLLSRVEESIQAAKGRKKRIYIIEEFDFMFSLVAGYVKEDYEVFRGPSVLQSLNHIEESNPDILLIDIDNSAFVLGRAREKSNELHLPIVLMTRDMNSSVAAKEKTKLNTSFVSLPLVRENLLEVLDSLEVWRE